MKIGGAAGGKGQKRAMKQTKTTKKRPSAGKKPRAKTPTSAPVSDESSESQSSEAEAEPATAAVEQDFHHARRAAPGPFR